MYNMVEAIMQFGASDKLDGDAWSTLVTNIQSARKEGRDLQDVLKNAEKEFKEKTGKALPGKWRSAKSVALRAYNASVSLTDEQGLPVGKSAVEKLLKKDKVPKNTEKLFAEALNTVEAIIIKEPNDVMRKAYVFELRELADRLGV